MAVKPRKSLREVLSWAAYIFAGFILAVIISHFVIVNAKVTSESMETTIMTNDRIIGMRLAYLFDPPKRLDIVIFTNPTNPAGDPYVKRIIGLPDDKVEFRDNEIYINDSAYPLDEPYIAEPMVWADSVYEVPKGHYFMLGDNRNHSTDSRKLANPYIPRADIIGKVYYAWFPSFRTLR